MREKFDDLYKQIKKISHHNLEEIKDLGDELHSLDIEDSYGIVSLSFNMMTNRKNSWNIGMALSTISSRAHIYNFDQESGFTLQGKLIRSPGRENS